MLADGFAVPYPLTTEQQVEIERLRNEPGHLYMRDQPEPFGTGGLPDEVVNKRVIATVWMSSAGQRHGRWGVGVWMDDQQADDSKPFTIGNEGWKGIDGHGLTADEATYIASTLYAAARRMARAADVLKAKP